MTVSDLLAEPALDVVDPRPTPAQRTGSCRRRHPSCPDHQGLRSIAEMCPLWTGRTAPSTRRPEADSGETDPTDTWMKDTLRSSVHKSENALPGRGRTVHRTLGPGLGQFCVDRPVACSPRPAPYEATPAGSIPDRAISILSGVDPAVIGRSRSARNRPPPAARRLRQHPHWHRPHPRPMPHARPSARAWATATARARRARPRLCTR